MVEMDELLRTTLKRVAEPGDPTGVADAIRSRVVAGDTGTPASRPPFDRGSWLPWIGTGLAVALVGGAIGASGLFGQPATAEAPSAALVSDTVSAGLCPGATGAATFTAGTRVVATARTDDAAYLAVRSDRTSIVWLPTEVVSLDSGEISSLPVDGCLVPLISEGEASPEPGPAPDPAPEPEPPPAPAPAPAPAPVPPPPPVGDTQAPTGLQASANPPVIYNSGSTVLTASASDNVAVTGFSVTWSGAHSGSAQLAKAGGQWQYTYTPPASYGDVTFTFTAHDAAGNASATTSVVVSHQYFG